MAATPGGALPPKGNRTWLGVALGAGALVVAAGAFLLGHATATAHRAAVADATTLNALSSATTAPTGMTCTGVGRGVAGTLKSVNGTTLTVTGPKGADVTVKTDSSTKITKVVTGSLNDVTAGATVAVRGTGTGTGTTIAADDVALLPADLSTPPAIGKFPMHRAFAPAGGAAKGGLAVGTVQSVSSSGFTLSAGGTTITVTTSSSTVFAKTVSASVKDLVVGQPIAVAGTPNADGSITAEAAAQSTVPGGLGKLPGFGFGFGFGFGPPGGRIGHLPMGPGGGIGATPPSTPPPSTTPPTTTP